MRALSSRVLCDASQKTLRHDELYMLPLIASCLLGWSVNSSTPNVLHDREHHYAEAAAMASLPPMEEGKAQTLGLANLGLDQLGSIEWRGMMMSLMQRKIEERRAANRAASSQK